MIPPCQWSPKGFCIVLHSHQGTFLSMHLNRVCIYQLYTHVPSKYFLLLHFGSSPASHFGITAPRGESTRRAQPSSTSSLPRSSSSSLFFFSYFIFFCLERPGSCDSRAWSGKFSILLGINQQALPQCCSRGGQKFAQIPGKRNESPGFLFLGRVLRCSSPSPGLHASLGEQGRFKKNFFRKCWENLGFFILLVVLG